MDIARNVRATLGIRNSSESGSDDCSLDEEVDNIDNSQSPSERENSQSGEETEDHEYSDTEPDIHLGHQDQVYEDDLIKVGYSRIRFRRMKMLKMKY